MHRRAFCKTTLAAAVAASLPGCSGEAVYPLTRDFLAFYAELNESLPDEANLEPQLIPNDEGAPIIVAQATWCGDHAAGAKALAPLLAFPGRLSGELGPRSYQAIQTADDEFLGHGRQYYLKSGLLNELTPAAIDVIVEYQGWRATSSAHTASPPPPSRTPAG